MDSHRPLRPAEALSGTADALGGSGVLGGPIISAVDLHERLEAGLPLDAEEGDRLWKAAHIFIRAEAILGSRAKASSWFQQPCRALGGQKPMTLVSTQPGYDEVLAVLGRILDGVWS